MNRFTIRFKDSNVLKLIEECCEITYQSPVIELVFVKTELTREELMDIEGVFKVETPRVGRLCI